jgi:hypothetical protein
LRARGIADDLLYWWVVKLAGKSIDDTLCHPCSKGVILTACLALFVAFLTAKMTLAGFAVHNFTGSGDLKSFGNTFVRLSHNQKFGKRKINKDLGQFDQAK